MDPHWRLIQPDLNNENEWTETGRRGLIFNYQTKAFSLADQNSPTDDAISFMILYKHLIIKDFLAVEYRLPDSTPFLRKWYLKDSPNDYGAEILISKDQWRIKQLNEILVWNFILDSVSGKIEKFFLSLHTLPDKK